MRIGFGSNDDDDENDEFPLGRDYWNQDENSSIYKSDPYESTMYVPFTERTVEFSFLNGTSKTITFDESDRFDNPKQEEVGNIHREKYYKFDDISFGYFRNRPYKNIADFMLSTSDDKKPEIMVTTANQTYTEPQEKRDMVAVIKATVVDIYTGSLMKWELEEIHSVERVSIDDTYENDIRYPTEGAIPHYVDKL
jgi:hypothetical protein